MSTLQRAFAALALLPLLSGCSPGVTHAQGDEVHSTSFEECSGGPFTTLRSDAGIWRAADGHARVSANHARTGEKCVQIRGGDDARIELSFSPLTEVNELEFWAERWTRADPFEVKVWARDSRKWTEVHDASESIETGGFKTRVRVALEIGTTEISLACTAPSEKGVLIDDVVIAPLRPMEVTACRVAQEAAPVLVGNRVNPVARIEVETVGRLEPLTLAQLTIDLAGTTRTADFERIEVFAGGTASPPGRDVPDEIFGDADRFGEAVEAPDDSAVELSFDGGYELEAGVNTFWISVTPKAGADIDGFVDAGLISARLAGGEALDLDDPRPPVRQRLGVALRTANDDGSKAYRIPGVVTTNAGTLIAVYDIRWKGWVDLPGHIDVGMSRSTDGGRTWEPMRVIMDMGDDPEWRGEGIGDPSILVDHGSGAVHVLATWSHGDRAWRGSGPGLTPDETGQLMLTTSTDDGVTWGKPQNLTGMLKDPKWSYLLQGPGRGITMGDGKLVFPAQFQLSPDEDRTPHSTVITSDDGGVTWRIGTGAKDDTTESAVCEIEDGVLMLNMRDNRGGSRSVFTSTDLGATWTEHATSRKALMEPTCMASLIHVGRELTGEADGRLLFSNPAVPSAPRRRMSIRASDDAGVTWPEERILLLDEGASAGYSCLTMIDNETVGIVYEGSRAHLTFQRVPLADLFPADVGDR